MGPFPSADELYARSDGLTRSLNQRMAIPVLSPLGGSSVAPRQGARACELRLRFIRVNSTD